MIIDIIPIIQPIGTFYVGALPAEVIDSITIIRQRKYDKKFESIKGIQRKEAIWRINEISEYCSDPDSTFPTPIIIAVQGNANCKVERHSFEFNENEKLGEIIDGQHRILGLKNSKFIDKFTLPVIFMFDLTEEEKAYVFSIINSKQTKVPMSLIYDLFELSTKRSPQKSCHEIARLLNADESSPFYGRLKMLGEKQSEFESLSQGSFVKYLLPLLSKNPDKDLRDIKNNTKLTDDTQIPLRYYFINDQDDIIYKIIFNLFSALKDVFNEEWNNPNRFILSKTTGYGAVLKAFKDLYGVGTNKNDLSATFFSKVFENLKSDLESKNIKLTSEHFSSNEQTQKRLAVAIVESAKKLTRF